MENTSELLRDMFIENGHNKAFLENLVKHYHNAKKKNNSNRN